MAVRPSTLANPFCLKKSSTREKWQWGSTDEIFLRMHQSKNLQVSLLSAGRNTDKNCNQSAIHTDESDGDDSDGIIDQISLTKNPARRKAAVPDLVLAEGKIPAYRPGLPRVSVVRAEGGLSEKLSPLFCVLLQKLPLSSFAAPFCPGTFMLLMPSYDSNTAFKLLSHQWLFRSIHLSLLLFWIFMGFGVFPLPLVPL